MKIWIKYLAGILVGAAAGLFIPFNETILEKAPFIIELITNICLYLFIPYIFFSVPVAVCQLRRDKKFLNICLRTILYTLVLGLIAVLLGIGISLLFSPGRIPIVLQEQVEINFFNTESFLLQITGDGNLFNFFIFPKTAFLPLLLLALILGYHFHFDKEQAEPAYNFFDSLSRILYHINSGLTEIYTFILPFFSAYTLIQIRNIPDISIYRKLLFNTGTAAIIYLFLILPALLYFGTGKKRNPYRFLYSIFAPLMTGFLSGNHYICYNPLSRHIKENLGIPRKTSTVSLPFSLLFSRAGTAMISGISMLIILKSYSSLEITPFQILWVITFSFLISFILFNHSGQSLLISLATLSLYYGRGLEDSFLLLFPVIPLLTGIAVVLDAATGAFILFLSAHKTGVIEEEITARFI